MAKIIPFKAVRPTRDKVGLVAARPIKVILLKNVNREWITILLVFYILLILVINTIRIITGEERYNLVKNRYLEFKEDGIFIQDEKPCYYVYKIVNRHNQEFNGIIAATSAEDYENNVIKKHEDTIANREETFKTYLKTVGFNAEPVLLTYPDNDVISVYY